MIKKYFLFFEYPWTSFLIPHPLPSRCRRPQVLIASLFTASYILQSNVPGVICSTCCSLVIQNAHDCHQNPGPRLPKFPCQECGKACKWSKTVRSVACSNCENWFHTDCLHMNTAVHEALEASDVSWYCCNCGIPNFNTSLFEDFLPSSSDSLHTSRSSISSDGFVLDTSNIGLPKSTSSPLLGSASPFPRGNYA